LEWPQQELMWNVAATLVFVPEPGHAIPERTIVELFHPQWLKTGSVV
jgi:hypothetical protein